MHYKKAIVGGVLIMIAAVGGWSWANRRSTYSFMPTLARYEVEKEFPRTVNNPDLDSRSLWQFPIGTPDEDVIAELRAHLEGVAKKAPEQRVRVHALLKRPMPTDSFYKLVSEHELTSESGSELRILRFNRSPLNVDVLTDSASSVVESFVLWGTAQNLLSAWRHHDHEIRGMLTLGIREDALDFGFQPTLLPGKPLNAGHF